SFHARARARSESAGGCTWRGCSDPRVRDYSHVASRPQEPLGLVETEGEVEILHGLARGSLAEVVRDAEDDAAAPALACDADERARGSLHPTQLGRSVDDADERLGTVRVVEDAAHRGRLGIREERGDEDAAHERSRLRHEA